MWDSAINLFRGACGLEAPWVLRCEEAGPDHEVESRSRLALPFVIIGRDQDQGPRLDAPEVSRRHALLQMIGGRLRVIDLQSRTGVVWESPAEAPEGDLFLDPGQAIRIGPYRLSWSRGEGDARASADPTDAPAIASSRSLALAPRAPEGAFVMPIRIDDEESLWRVDEDLTLIGRSKPCRMVLNDQSVSRIHAVVARTPLGVWIVDAGSREGVVVSGVRVRWAWLDDGDTVRLGRFTFVFRYLTPFAGIKRDDVPYIAGAADDADEGRPPNASRPRSGQAGRELAMRSSSGRSRGVVRVGPSAVTPAATTARLNPAADAVWTSPSSAGGIPVELWQRQMEMMESFHNDMIAMVQTFFAIHREHQASVREEMARVEELTAELDALRRRMSESDAAPGRADASPQSPPVPNAPSRDRAARGQEADGHDPRPQTKPKPGAASPHPAPVPPPGGERITVASPEMHGFIANRIATLQRERQGYWRRILNQINS